jgi:hypothetical protein
VSEFDKLVSRMVGFARRRLRNDTVRPLCYAPGSEYKMADGRKARGQDTLICAAASPDGGWEGFVRVLDKGAFDDFDLLIGLRGGGAEEAAAACWVGDGRDKFRELALRDRLEDM